MRVTERGKSTVAGQCCPGREAHSHVECVYTRAFRRLLLKREDGSLQSLSPVSVHLVGVYAMYSGRMMSRENACERRCGWLVVLLLSTLPNECYGYNNAIDDTFCT